MGIVEEVVDAIKTILDGLLTGYSRLDYEFNVENNSDRGNDTGFGFIPGSATFAEGRAMGFTTMDHNFILKLVDCYQPKDDDSALRTALFTQYGLIQDSLKELQKSKLALPTPSNRILLISGLSFDDPDINEENHVVELRANFVIRYSFRNN